MLKKIINIDILVIIIWAVAFAFASPAQAVSRVPSEDSRKSPIYTKIKPQVAARINEALSRSGKVRIIVAMASPDEPEATLRYKRRPDSAGRARQRDSVQRLQERVLGKMFNPKAVKRFRNFSYLALEVDPDELSQLQEMDEVVSIAEDELWRATLDSSAPQIGADAAWTGGYTGTGQTVAIIDTGVDGSHPSLAGKVVAEACFSTATGSSTSLCPAGENPGGSDYQVGPGAGQNCSVNSSCNHGTHVAGIAAGSSSTYTGIAPDAYLMAIQVYSRFEGPVCGSASSCILAFSSDTLRALDWIYDQRDAFSIASVNISLGGGKYQSVADCNQDNSALAVAVDRLRSGGIATVASSGNNGYTSAMIRPGCISGVISVGGVGATDNVASWSNSAPWLTVLAPGTSIKSSIPGTGYANKSGTSMAAPHVAGAIAAMRSADPLASVDQIVAAMTSTGVPVTDSRNGLIVPRVQLDAAIAELTLGSVIPKPEPAPGGEVAISFLLQPNSKENGKHGWSWGDNQHKTVLAAAFQSTGANFELSVTGYDIDQADELSVYLNGTLLGYLSVGANNSLNGGDTFAIPASIQLSGENRIEFRQKTAGWIWGVTNLLLKDAASASKPVTLTLIPNSLESAEHGWRWGDNAHKTDLTFAFAYTGADFDLSVTGYDIDFDDEISVYLNGTLLGHLSAGLSNNSLNGGDSFVIPASEQLTGENRLVFQQNNPGWIWGVTNLLLSAAAPATIPAAVTLYPGSLDSTMHGWRWGDSSHKTDVTAAFAYTGADFNLSVTGYDIDFDDEVTVYLNGVILGYLSAGLNNNSRNGGDTFVIPASEQQTGENRLVFQQNNPGWIWGVTNLLLSEMAPAAVTLYPGSLDSTMHGWRWGDSSHKTDISVAFEHTGADFNLSVTGYDIDFDDEVTVYLNGAILGYLSAGLNNNSRNGGDMFVIPASEQRPGENRLVFQQNNPGWIWGITDLLLSQQ